MSARRPLPRWADVALLPLLNLVLAMVVSGIVIALIGQNPFEAMRIMAYGAFGYGEGIGFTLHFATDFIFTGLAVAVAEHLQHAGVGRRGHFQPLFAHPFQVRGDRPAEVERRLRPVAPQRLRGVVRGKERGNDQQRDEGERTGHFW